ncbi:hypothetical protein, partial [Stenotrophomonas maltophilia]|uniref:hypothetical protein n=1 Tax=Stenotrophomonas maltophilia TaxID=40324 RepID=UPI000D6749FC
MHALPDFLFVLLCHTNPDRQQLLAVRIGVAEQHEQEIGQGVHGATGQAPREPRRGAGRPHHQRRGSQRAERGGGMGGVGEYDGRTRPEKGRGWRG